MITTTMNAAEVMKHAKNDIKHYFNKLISEQKKLEKMARKMPCSHFSKTINLRSKASQQKYIIHWHKRPAAKHVTMRMLACVDVTPTKTNYYNMSIFNDDVNVCTHHCLERYNERAKLNTSMDKVLDFYMEDTAEMIRVYKNDKTHQGVYASRSGLILAVENPETNIITECTYISSDMLKPSQRGAYNIAKEFFSNKNIDRLDGIMLDKCLSNDKKSMYIFDAEFQNILDEAQDLYGDFFEDSLPKGTRENKDSKKAQLVLNTESATRARILDSICELETTSIMYRFK